MMFKSRQVNLDPKPYVDEMGTRTRWLAGELLGLAYAPRPEFEPTRDRYPWAVSTLEEGGLPDFRVASLEALEAMPHFDKFDFLVEWAPRREQFDTPVNRVLSGLREDWQESDDFGHDLRAHAAMWLSTEGDWQAPPDEADHARRVLARLVNWEGR